VFAVVLGVDVARLRLGSFWIFFSVGCSMFDVSSAKLKMASIAPQKKTTEQPNGQLKNYYHFDVPF